MKKSTYSLVIIGAGPAGIAAAITAQKHNIDAIVVDQQNSPGGQIYRALESSPLNDPSLLGTDYVNGGKLIERFRSSGVEYIPNAAVWNIDRIENGDHELGVLVDGKNNFVRAHKLLLATGAQERPMPIPGWQLPGVMTAGAAQILMKSSAAIPDHGVVLAGSGPLLLLLACQYLRAGVSINAILDTTPRGAIFTTLPLLPRALPDAKILANGIRMMMQIRRARIPVYKHVTSLSAEGNASLEQVNFTTGERTDSLPTKTLLLHHGVTPGIHFPQLLGCKLIWRPDQHCWQPQLDAWGESDVDNVFICGDGAAISGAIAAELQGKLGALQIAHQLNTINREKRDFEASSIKKCLRKQTSIRPFLDAIYQPFQQCYSPTDDTIVCRCEEVTAGEVRRVAKLGCTGPNQAKAFTRCGMGPCQGRQCGDVVSALIANIRNQSIADTGYYRARPPLSPVTLGQLASNSEI